MDRPSPRSLAELESEITELAGHLNAAHYRWLTLIAEFGRAFDHVALGSVATGRTAPLGDWTQLQTRHRAEGVHIDESTAVTRWRGERMDYGIAVDALLARSMGVPAGMLS